MVTGAGVVVTGAAVVVTGAAVVVTGAGVVVTGAGVVPGAWTDAGQVPWATQALTTWNSEAGIATLELEHPVGVSVLFGERGPLVGLAEVRP